MHPEQPPPMWYEDWFNSPYYEILYGHRDQQEASSFVHTIARHLDIPPKARVLDLACGSGRFASALHNQGYQVTGIDIATRSIALAKKNYTHIPIQFIKHDMLLPFPESRFDVIFNFFTSFGYFEKPRMHQVLQNIHHALNPKGHILIDYMNCAKVKEKMVNENTVKKQKTTFLLNRKIENSFIVKNIKILDNPSNKHIASFQEKVYDLNYEGLNKLLLENQFSVKKTFGDYRLSAFDESVSDRLIVYAQKNSP